MSDYELVKNNYKQDGDLLLRFEYEGEVYHVEMGRYLLLSKTRETRNIVVQKYIPIMIL